MEKSQDQEKYYMYLQNVSSMEKKLQKCGKRRGLLITSTVSRIHERTDRSRIQIIRRVIVWLSGTVVQISFFHCMK